MTPEQIFTTAFCTQQDDRYTNFLIKRIVVFGRLSMGASPAHKLFWQGQITSYHAQLKALMTNPVFKGVSDETEN